MKYYNAVTGEDEISLSGITEPKNILASYHYYKNKKDTIKKAIQNNYDVFIDSGAFSSMNSGKEINIDDYCEFLLDVGAIYYATLDVIGDAKKTLINHKYMINNYGLNPIPAFHLGSKIEDLKILLDYDYIALGGLVFSGGIMHHCDEVFHYILSNKPNLKVHGFGLTNIELMKRYPWYSVDSSSFKSCKRFGRQNVLWNGLNFKTFTEKEYQIHLEKLGVDFNKIDNKTKYRIYDYYSSQSYSLYAAHLTELNKYRDFKHLIQQYKLF
tara:strand:- start:1459 stop:2265 length:807 start_codon:yes stop_codon:yes gene_type:complete